MSRQTLQLLTFNDLARHLGRDYQIVRHHVLKSGMKPLGKVGNTFVFSKSDLPAIRRIVESHSRQSA